MSVHSSVRSVQTCLEQSIFIFLGQRELREHSESTQRTLKEHSKNCQRALKALKSESYQSEPKILRLVVYELDVIQHISNDIFGVTYMFT